jgi:phosphoenolpyruvate carboxylase
MPFRGHLSPDNVKRFLLEYKGLATATTQSALRYDYPVEKVKSTVRALNENLPNGEAAVIEPDEERLLRSCLDKFKTSYQARVEELAPLITSIASYVPQRRARKLHIGLFGYSRSVKGIAMPRAIPFAAAFYSLGIPPEFIGAEAMRELTEIEWNCLRSCYTNMKVDLGYAANYVSWEGINMLMDAYESFAKMSGTSRERLKDALGMLMADLATAEETFSIRLGPHDHDAKRHENFINNFLISYLEGEDPEARTAFMEAAHLRKCLG